ncbi:MAG: molybdopterin-synthase adenylyltransferase MoeB [Arenimonas sp.]|uniref:molybdopterin-synthase adenylyltransferase MoeB n=1 Tax=Arenimonas sp. TaxID=1872635 RepID=UPI003C026241
MPVTVISPEQALEMQASGHLLIDVREPDEWASGIAEGAKPVSKGELQAQACHHLASLDQPVVLICAGGKRSDACAAELSRQGYTNLFSVSGGTQAWMAAGLPVAPYRATDFDRRYARQMILPNVGREGQQKLIKARVLLVGAGGLGSPCAYYLAAAGVGHLILVDDDRVDLSNLQRQILHKNSNVGELKVTSAKSTLNDLNPSISVEVHADRITEANINNYINNIDLVIDGTDNFKARYAISDACAQRGIPWVYGAVHRFEGQVSLFHASVPESRGLCYRCLFPEPMNAVDAPNCTEAGVLGVAPGVVGVLQATEALKYLLGIGESLSGRLLHIDLLSMAVHDTVMSPDPDCPCCGPNEVQRCRAPSP